MHPNLQTPLPQTRDDQQALDVLTAGLRAMLAGNPGTPEVRHVVPPSVVKGLAEAATHAWKAKGKMVDATTGEARPEMKRVYRHVEGILDCLHEIGIEVKDHTGDAFDYGLPVKVVTNQPTPGLVRERVVETIKPTVFWQQQMIQMGEVIIATPAASETNP